MTSLRNNRRFLGAILLIAICLVATAAPAAAIGDHNAILDDELANRRFSRVLDRFEAAFSSAIQKLGMFWSAAGAVIED